MAEIEDKLLGSNYDGIKEFDNPMPGWWIGVFVITIIWAIGYITFFTITGVGDTPQENYQQEMAAAEERLAKLAKEGGEEQLEIAVLTKPANLKSGKQIFTTNCASCHAQDGGGGVGPNLTDQYWIHGGDFASIYETILNGVAEKGMISWKPLLSQKEMLEVSSYIDQRLRGTTPENPKDPQGEIYNPE